MCALKSDELRIRTGLNTNCGQNALIHTDSSQFISLHAVLVRGVSVLIVMSLNFLSAKHSSGNIPRRYAIVYTAVLMRFLTRTKDCARVTAFCLVRSADFVCARRRGNTPRGMNGGLSVCERKFRQRKTACKSKRLGANLPRTLAFEVGGSIIINSICQGDREITGLFVRSKSTAKVWARM